MDFYDRIGVMALGSRLRRLGDRLGEEAARIYALYGTELQPRWFPVFFLLGERDEESVSAIAEAIGHTHASVSQIVSEMVKQGYAVTRKGMSDGRKSFVTLTPRGRETIAKVRFQCSDVGAAVGRMLAESDTDLWAAIAACERSLAHRPLFDRVLAQKLEREGIRVVDFRPGDEAAFRRLNLEWIEAHFTVEEADRKALDHPRQTILEPGGHILIALNGEEPVGTCALIPHGDGCLELAKMAVSPAARGKRIGWLLGQAALDKARQHGAQRVYLESNTVLEPAIALYRKLGFREVTTCRSPYSRCNIQMEKDLA